MSNPYNVYNKEPTYSFIIYAVVVTIIENYILYKQGTKGAFFFIPKFLRKGYYNYYKTQSEIQKLSIDFNSLECTICLRAFYDGESIGNGCEKDYSIFMNNICYDKLMITPCKHVFHSECLQAWIVVRLECPICKQVLPYTD